MHDIDLDALEEAYEHALALEKAGKSGDAIDAWRAVLALDPDDRGGAAIRLAPHASSRWAQGAAPENGPAQIPPLRLTVGQAVLARRPPVQAIDHLVTKVAYPTLRGRSLQQ